MLLLFLLAIGGTQITSALTSIHHLMRKPEGGTSADEDLTKEQNYGRIIYN